VSHFIFCSFERFKRSGVESQECTRQTLWGARTPHREVPVADQGEVVTLEPIGPVIEELRDQISALDDHLLKIINDRAERVAALGQPNVGHGFTLARPTRDAELTSYLRRLNESPLSSEAVYELLGRWLQPPPTASHL
jgi:chorismate mutase